MKINAMVHTVIIQLASRIPAGFRVKITRGLLESQGIGWGASTTDFEAKSAVKILNELGIKNPVSFDGGANIGDVEQVVYQSLSRRNVLYI